MTTRRELIFSLPGAGAAFAVGGSMMLDSAPARTAPALLAGHFHPKGKAPSEHTVAALERAQCGS